MIESCIVIVFLCLLFMGLFQLIHASVSRELLYHAAACAARARTVGLNRWMVEKTMRVAAIPNAGTLTQPAAATVDPALLHALATLQPGALWDYALQSTPQSPTINAELARIPLYLGSQNHATGQQILDYANWDTIQLASLAVDNSAAIDPASAARITALVKQPHELLVALDSLMAGSLSASPDLTTNITLSGRYRIEAHYPLYLDVQGDGF